MDILRGDVLEVERKRVIVSWSGGKDCCLALHRVLEAGYEVVGLLSMVSEEHSRNRAHGIPLRCLQLQAEALALPLILIDSGDQYGQRLAEALARLRHAERVDAVAFGSLYADRDRGWNEGVAAAAGLTALFPVWMPKDRAGYHLGEWIDLGYHAVVCRADSRILDQSWAGRPLDRAFYHDIHQTDACPMGENGEYHTFVVNGPIFRQRLEITRSETVLNAGLWSLDIQDCRLVAK